MAWCRVLHVSGCVCTRSLSYGICGHGSRHLSDPSECVYRLSLPSPVMVNGIISIALCPEARVQVVIAVSSNGLKNGEERVRVETLS